MISVVVINGGNGGSTGNIIWGIREIGLSQGYSFSIFTPPGRSQLKDRQDNYFIGKVLTRRFNEKMNQLTGSLDGRNKKATYDLISAIDQINPGIVHLHNLHGNYINITILFRYLRKKSIPVVWTLHDCWSFTGQCSHYIVEACEKWKTGCYECSNIRKYPPAFVDNTYKMYRKKKKLFTSIGNMIIVTPSCWLKKQVEESYLKHYAVRVINNGIDLEIFKPQKSDFREKHGIVNKFIILCVSSVWNYAKGLDRIVKLSGKLHKNEVIVVVGECNTISNAKHIIKIGHTNSQSELADIYSAADVFFNPTREDTFPTVNLEALACGTPILSYGACGSAEAFDETCGTIVNDDTVIKKLEELRLNNYDMLACRERASLYDHWKKYKEYMDLYETMIKE